MSDTQFDYIIVGAEAVREQATGSACADDDVVKLGVAHG